MTLGGTRASSSARTAALLAALSACAAPLDGHRGPARAGHPPVAHVAAAQPVVRPIATTEVEKCGPVRIPPEPAGLGVAPGPFDPPRIAIARPESLRGFYEALAGLIRGRATQSVRIAVFGDSNLTMDFPTGRMRRKLQRWFGDGGHGFVALARPWSHYHHMDVRHDMHEGWEPFAITTKPLNDALYGLAGIVAQNERGGVSTWVETAPAGSIVGTAVSRFDFFYIQREKGGSVDLVLDGQRVKTVDTRGAAGLGFERLATEDGPHRLDVVSGKGVSRVVGVALERSRPGIVIDSFGVGSMNTKSLGRHDGAVFTEMLARRHYDLIVFATGANDLFTMDAVPETFQRVLGWCKQALPKASILMVTPPDRGLLRPMAQTQKVVVQRRAISEREGTALWDQFAAMGGAGAMRKFVIAGYAIEDAIHFNEKGAAFMADRLLESLMRGFEAYVEGHVTAGCE